VEATTIAELSTAGGTLVLAMATFASVRSANRAARVAERSLALGLRPLLVQSRPEDPPEPVMWPEGKLFEVGNGFAQIERDEGDDGNIYMAIPLRNVGAGMGVIHGWHLISGWQRQALEGAPDVSEFRQQLRDLYIPPGDTGFWQATVRDADDKYRPDAEEALAGGDGDGLTIFLLYGDHEGHQRTISRFGLRPQEDGRWFCSVSRHWNLEGPDPRAYNE
jgi:hypothetical protein